MPAALLIGTEGPWPFLGHFRGSLGVVSWAGSVAGTGDPEVAFLAARAVDHVLGRGGPVSADRRRSLSILWARLGALDRSHLGPTAGQDLVLLMCSEDERGGALCGVGLGALYALDVPDVPWISGAHPLLGTPGLPLKRPGVLTVDLLPDLVATACGDERALSGTREEVLTACGVRP